MTHLELGAALNVVQRPASSHPAVRVRPPTKPPRRGEQACDTGGASSPETAATAEEWGSNYSATPPGNLAEDGGRHFPPRGGGLVDRSVPCPKTSGQAPRRPHCNCAEHLIRVAPDEANGSRDFGRGFMWAARVLQARGVA